MSSAIVCSESCRVVSVCTKLYVSKNASTDEDACEEACFECCSNIQFACFDAFVRQRFALHPTASIVYKIGGKGNE